MIAGSAVVLLGVLAATLFGPVRRFRAALSAYRERLDSQASLLQAGRAEVRDQLSTIGHRGLTEERHG
jgi:hypothetical protein